jgi:hypothetical protein
VNSYHLRILGEWLVTIDYICYRGDNQVLINERIPDRTAIEKQQGMEVLGAYLSPSVSIKDQIAVRPCSRTDQLYEIK